MTFLMACLLLAQPANTLSDEERREGWVLLFDGKSLKGWLTSPLAEPPEPAWAVENGTLRTTPGRGVRDYLVSEAKFRDFEFRFEWMVEAEANSGVKYRAQAWSMAGPGAQDVQATWKGAARFEPLACEYQIADDEKNPDAIADAKHSTGALYEYVAPRKSKAAGPGVWHSGRIVVRGLHFEHWLDGEKVTEGDFHSEEMRLSFQASKRRLSPKLLAAHEVLESPVILQNHNGVVWFRNLKIRRL